MDFLEKDLEDIIFSADSETLYDRGLRIHKNRKRQLKVGNYGIIDILAVKRCEDSPYFKYLDIQIFELKRYEITWDSFAQVLTYCKGVNDYIQAKHENLNYSINLNIVGRNINKNSSLVYLPEMFSRYYYNGISGVSLYTYEYGIDGIKFTEIEEFELKNKGF